MDNPNSEYRPTNTVEQMTKYTVNVEYKYKDAESYETVTTSPLTAITNAVNNIPFSERDNVLGITLTKHVIMPIDTINMKISLESDDE